MPDDLPLDLSDGIQASLRKLDGGEDPSPVSREILLELADHLQCAARREQLVEGPAGPVNDEQIWKRVLHRFGDPARVAWQLWWDANWEKLMSQRITNILLAVLIVACLGLGFLTWRSMSLYRVAMEQARAEALRSQAQAEQMLLTLKEQAEASRRAAAPSEWNQVAFELRYDSPTGDLVEGATVTIAGLSPNTKSIPRQELKSGPDGLADFGQLLFGEYTLQVKLPNKAVLVGKIGVRPGKEFRETIVCPLEATRPVSISIEDLPLPPEFAIPEEVRNRIWYRVTLFRHSDTDAFESLQGNQAIHGGWVGPLKDQTLTVFLRPDGSWVYPGSPKDAVPELTQESLRFCSRKPEAESFLAIGDRLAAGKGERLLIPLGNYMINNVETFVELNQIDGTKCLARVFDYIDHPQTWTPLDAQTHVYSTTLSCGTFDFAVPQILLPLFDLYRHRLTGNLSVDLQSPPELVLSPTPSACVSLALRSKLPPGKILCQLVIVHLSTEASTAVGVASGYVDIFPKKDKERIIANHVPVVASRRLTGTADPALGTPGPDCELIVVGLNLAEAESASYNYNSGEDLGTFHMRPAQKPYESPPEPTASEPAN